jgi:hypothetical protein
MAGYTPGPWRTDERHGSPRNIYASFEDGYDEMLATAYEMDHGSAFTGEANARLIAAAPDMLQVLKEVATKDLHTDWCKPAEPCWECKVRAAIAKAEGQP